MLSGVLAGTGGFADQEFTVDDLPGGLYTFQTAFTASLRGHPSPLEVLAEFDTRRPDPNPPWLRSLHVEVDGEMTDSVAFTGASDVAVRLALIDGEGQLSLPSLSVRSIDQYWKPLAVTREGDGYTAPLPPHLDGIIAMKLEGMDDSGNRLALHWDRAFIASSGTTDVLISARSAAVVDGVVELSWHAGGLGERSVTIQRREASDAWLAIGSAGVDLSGLIEYADSTSQAGQTYGYRVLLANAGTPIHGGGIWITADGPPVLALADARPNPVTVQPFLIDVSLASTERARLSFIDLAGRQVVDQDLGARRSPGAIPWRPHSPPGRPRPRSWSPKRVGQRR